MAQEHDVVQETLEREAADCESELSRLERQEQEINRRVVELRLTMKAYRSVLERRRTRDVSTPSAPLFPDLPSPKTTPPDDEALGSGRTPGNRNPTMPTRIERFGHVSVADAILELAEEWKMPRHSNEYARAIWHIDTKSDLKRARRTLNSTIGRLARDGKLASAGSARYGPKEPAMTP